MFNRSVNETWFARLSVIGRVRRANVRFGSLAEVGRFDVHVRSSPQSRPKWPNGVGLLGATSRHY